MIFNYKQLVSILTVASISTQLLNADCYAHSIFVPRQIAYNPMYEDALIFDEYAHMDQFLLSVKPIYTQTVGNSLKKYFNINHACTMQVAEDGSGDIDSLWFQVISSPDTFYSSTLSFSPVQKTYGALLYFAWLLPEDFAITINTAIIERKNNMHICETNIKPGTLGQVPGIATMKQAFANPSMLYGKICGTRSESGFDDVQIKVLKNFRLCDDASFFGDIYALVGIPTGSGSRAQYLFEPLVGSKHAQFGLGFNVEKSFDTCLCNELSIYGEFKWRYGFKGTEIRSFDMSPNGQWSRYLLFTTPTDTATPFPAINNLTFKTEVTPRNSLDLLLAAHVEVDAFSFELGYNVWYRQAEKVSPCITLPQVGIADLVGIAQLNNPNPVIVTSSSKATISEGVFPNEFQMPRDTSYTLVTPGNINLCSGAQPTAVINGIFGSIGYRCNAVDFGINASYEGANSNTASVASVWANIDIRF